MYGFSVTSVANGFLLALCILYMGAFLRDLLRIFMTGRHASFLLFGPPFDLVKRLGLPVSLLVSCIVPTLLITCIATFSPQRLTFFFMLLAADSLICSLLAYRLRYPRA